LVESYQLGINKARNEEHNI